MNDIKKLKIIMELSTTTKKEAIEIINYLVGLHDLTIEDLDTE